MIRLYHFLMRYQWHGNLWQNLSPLEFNLGQLGSTEAWQQEPLPMMPAALVQPDPVLLQFDPDLFDFLVNYQPS